MHDVSYLAHVYIINSIYVAGKNRERYTVVTYIFGSLKTLSAQSAPLFIAFTRNVASATSFFSKLKTSYSDSNLF